MKRQTGHRYASALVVASLAFGVIVTGLANQSRAGSAAPRAPVVYETKVACCQTIVLGSAQNATLIATTPPLPAGTYLVHAVTNAVIGPSDGHVTCATAPTMVGGNDGIFGYSGNGATDSGSGPNGVYGSNVILDTWTITSEDTIYLYCWVGNFGQGTYVSQAVITAERLARLVEG
jgi:hypothetical protein